MGLNGDASSRTSARSPSSLRHWSTRSSSQTWPDGTTSALLSFSGWLKQFRNEAQALLDAKCPPERPVFAPAVVDTTPVAPHALPALLPLVEPAVIEVSVGKATVRIRGAVDARTLAAVLKALKVLK